MELHHIEGLAFALAAMTLYGVYMVPRKRSDVANEVFSFWMGVGILIGSILIGIATGQSLHVCGLDYAIIVGCGVIWGTGTYGYSRAVQMIGLTRSTPVKNLSAIFGTLLGIIVFHEFTLSDPHSLVLTLAGSAAIVLSTALLGRVEAPSGNELLQISKRSLFVGFAWAFWAAVAYSIYTVPLKIMLSHGMAASTFLLFMGQGIFVGMALPLLVSRMKPAGAGVTRRDVSLAMASGLMWSVGSLAANLAVKLIGVAITWPLTKTTLVAVLYGVFVLREVDIARHKRDLILGMALSVVGVVLLALAVVGHRHGLPLR